MRRGMFYDRLRKAVEGMAKSPPPVRQQKELRYDGDNVSILPHFSCSGFPTLRGTLYVFALSDAGVSRRVTPYPFVVRLAREQRRALTTLAHAIPLPGSSQRT